MITAVDKYSDATTGAERSFLACVLIDAGRCVDAMGILNPDDFLDPVLGELFAIVGRLSQMGRPVSDSRFMAGELAGCRVFRDLGGAVGLAELMSSAVNAANAFYYAEQILNFSRRRKLRSIALSILESTSHDDIDMESIASEAIGQITETMNRTSETRDCTAGEAAGASILAMERLLRNEIDNGIQTGIRCIDLIAGAMKPGELVILAARPSIGKTTLAMNILGDAAKNGHRGLFVSCEMDRTAIGERLLANETAINCERISRALVNADQIDRLRNAATKLQDTPYRIIEASSPTVQQIGAWARAHAARYGLDFVVVDHLGLIRPTGKTRSLYEGTTEVAKDLKGLATSLKMPVLALCQLNRQGEVDTPRLSMLRDSGAIEENADKVWFLNREAGKTDAEFIIAKYRNGSVGAAEPGDLVFDKHRCSFKDVNGDMRQDFGAWN